MGSLSRFSKTPFASARSWSVVVIWYLSVVGFLASRMTMSSSRFLELEGREAFHPSGRLIGFGGGAGSVVVAGSVGSGVAALGVDPEGPGRGTSVSFCLPLSGRFAGSNRTLVSLPVRVTGSANRSITSREDTANISLSRTRLEP